MPSPRLTDGVVSLRLPVEGDAAAITAACQDPEVSRFTALPDPYEPGHAEEWIGAAPAAWRDGTSVPMVIVDGATGRLLGACSLLEIRDGRAEIGYWVDAAARGRGVATRAVVLLTDWALAARGLSVIELLCDVRNLPSRRVAEKAGYAFAGLTSPPARCAGRCLEMARYVRQNRSADDRFEGAE